MHLSDRGQPARPPAPPVCLLPAGRPAIFRVGPPCNETALADAAGFPARRHVYILLLLTRFRLPCRSRPYRPESHAGCGRAADEPAVAYLGSNFRCSLSDRARSRRSRHEPPLYLWGNHQREMPPARCLIILSLSPLYPRKRTSTVRLGMSAYSQKRTFPPPIVNVRS